MNKYVSPVVDLLYLENEDVLTLSNDKGKSDIFFDNAGTKYA